MRKIHLIILGLILLLGLFFRSYQLVERFEFAHDGDLYSWIVKDIVIDGHPRLIGQLTSAPGIFIGSLFYYLLIPFFLITKMDPVGAAYFGIIIGVATIISYYFVFSKLFKIEAGLIAASLYATLLATINTDRWVVPTITTNLWVVWYFYTVITIVRRDYRILPLLGILIGLIWHVHIALVPILIVVPVAMILSKSLPSVRQIVAFFLSFSATSLPLFIFEIKHGLGQTLSLIGNFTTPRESAVGWHKFTQIAEITSKNVAALFLAPQVLSMTLNLIFVALSLLSLFWLRKLKLLSRKEVIIFLVWFSGVVAFFEITSAPISEYYFLSINIIFITITTLWLFLLFKSSFLGKVLTLGILILVTVKNGHFLISQNYYHKGYVEKKAVAEYIVGDAKNKNFPCFSLNYITSPGENVGFRYFFFLKNAELAVPGRGSPVYSIVIPDEYATNEINMKFGHIGVILPKEIPPEALMSEACSGQNTNLTDPMFGYVE